MPRRILEGNVVSAKTDKTVTVLVERRYMHPVYKKYIKRTDKYAAHDEANTHKEGDRVSIIECRPISKSKRWTVVTGDEAAPAAKKEKPAKKEAVKKEEKAATKKPVAKKDEEKKAPAKKPAAKKETAKKAEKKAPAKKPAAKATKAKKTDKKDS